MTELRHNPGRSKSTRHMLDGAVRVFLSESLLIPTGLVTTIFLTRTLGPDSYGIYGLAVSIVISIEYIVSNIFGGASIKFISEAENWEPIASTVLKIYLLAGTAAAAGLWLLSGEIAALLDAPRLGSYLSLLAIDIPVFVLSTAYRHILIGIGKFRARAFTSSARWISRLVLIVILVEIGLSVEGAILGIILSSLLELILVRSYVRTPIFGRSSFRARMLLGYVTPLFLFVIGMRLFDRMDLLFVKALGGTAEQAGIYVAAQNLAIVPGLFATSYAPLLLSTLSRTVGAGNKEAASHLIATSYRIVIMLIPFAAMTAGCSHELVRLIFGAEYDGTAPVLSVLIFGSIATVLISVNYAVLTASGKPGLPLILAGPIVPVSIIFYFLVIPRFGMIGASFVYTCLAAAGATAMLPAVYHLWRIYPPLGTVIRSVIISISAYYAVRLWNTQGIFVIVKILLVTAGIITAGFVTGEFTAKDLRSLGSGIFSGFGGTGN